MLINDYKGTSIVRLSMTDTGVMKCLLITALVIIKLFFITMGVKTDF